MNLHTRSETRALEKLNPSAAAMAKVCAHREPARHLDVSELGAAQTEQMVKEEYALEGIASPGGEDSHEKRGML